MPNYICVDFALILAAELMWDLPVSWEGISFSSAQSTVCHQAKLWLSLWSFPRSLAMALLRFFFPRPLDFACIGIVCVGSWYEVWKLKHISREISLVLIYTGSFNKIRLFSHVYCQWVKCPPSVLRALRSSSVVVGLSRGGLNEEMRDEWNMRNLNDHRYKRQR